MHSSCLVLKLESAEPIRTVMRMFQSWTIIDLSWGLLPSVCSLPKLPVLSLKVWAPSLQEQHPRYVPHRDYTRYNTPSVGYAHKKEAAHVPPLNGWVDSVTNSLVSLQFPLVSTKATNTSYPRSHFWTTWTELSLHEDGGKTSLRKVRTNLWSISH
jgi:hypothetical protein